MKLFVFALINMALATSPAYSLASCLNLEGSYRLSLDQIKKNPIKLEELTPESCQYTNDASTSLFPGMKEWINKSEQSKQDRKSGKKVYSYLVKKDSKNNCEYFVLNSDQLYDISLVRSTILSKKTLPHLSWFGLDLRDYIEMDAKTFAINPENKVEKEATVRYGGVYAELEDQDFIQQQSNGNLLTNFKHKSSGVVYVVPMMFTHKSACLLKKIQ